MAKEINSITLKNTTYQNKPILNSVNLDYVPWENNSMVGAFTNCTNLNRVSNINENVTNMYMAFNNCTKLINVSEIPNSVTDMLGTFRDCWGLIDAPKLSNNIISMGGTFNFCKKLVNAPEIPSSVTSMIYTFANCYNLQNAPEIPSSVTSMYYTYYRCTNLINVPEIPSSVTNMQGTFINCRNLENAPDMSNSISVIDMYQTFNNCTKLINGPDLSNCTNLTNMVNTFYECTSLKNVPVIPNSVRSMYMTFYRCSELEKSPEIPNNVISMYGTFCNCVNLTGDVIIYSENVSTAINCFNKTDLIKNVYIPFQNNGVNTLTYNSFINVYSTNPSNRINGVLLMDIKDYLELKEWRYDTLGNGTKLLYEYVTNDTNIDLVVPSSNTILNNYNSNDEVNVPFYTKTEFNSVDLANVAFVNNDMTKAFYNCFNLTSVTNINENVTDMSGTFYNCNSLVNAPIIPNIVINMCETFIDCNNLENISSISNIVEDMNLTFYNCNSLVNAPIIPNSVTDMYRTFVNCFSLTGDIVIHSENISNAIDCFDNTSLLKDVYIPFKYTNGVSSNTYESFTENYSTDPLNRVNGVLLMDIKEYLALEDWRYDVGLNNEKILYEYRGEDIDIVVPNARTYLNDYNASDTSDMPFLEKQFNSVDLNNIPFINDNMFSAFYNSQNIDTVTNINENVTNMSFAFYNCISLVNAPVIPNSVSDMQGTFLGCSNLVNAPEIPNSVTDMMFAFSNCSDLTGDIIIYSENISYVEDCFNGTSLPKNVYIPFTYQNGEYTLTYNSFNQYYGTGQNGVTLRDLNGPDLSDYEITNNNGIVDLDKYIGSNTTVITPNI